MYTICRTVLVNFVLQLVAEIFFKLKLTCNAGKTKMNISISWKLTEYVEYILNLFPSCIHNIFSLVWLFETPTYLRVCFKVILWDKIWVRGNLVKWYVFLRMDPLINIPNDDFFTKILSWLPNHLGNSLIRL